MTPQSAEQWLAEEGFADSRAHSSVDIAALMERYAADLRAEVAQLRQDRDAEKALAIERHNWGLEQMASADRLQRALADLLVTARTLEAARDHLRARLRELAQKMKDTWYFDPRLGRCVSHERVCEWADLLAVLTEPPQHEKHEKTNTNAVTRSAETDVNRKVAPTAATD